MIYSLNWSYKHAVCPQSEKNGQLWDENSIAQFSCHVLKPLVLLKHLKHAL